MIKVEHISKQFKKVKAVDDVSLEVKKGEIVCLIGPSGSGKSTVLRCIHGLEVPETGHVYLNGEVLDPKKSNYQELRNKMGFVFQHFNLFPHMTVLENLTLSLTKVRYGLWTTWSQTFRWTKTKGSDCEKLMYKP